MTQKLTLKDFDAQMAVEKEMKQAMTTAHETKARSIVRSGFDCADVKMRDGEMLVSAIATALREAEAGERERCGKIAFDRADLWDRQFYIANSEGRSDDEDLYATKCAASLDIAQIILGHRRYKEVNEIRNAAARSEADE